MPKRGRRLFPKLNLPIDQVFLPRLLTRPSLVFRGKHMQLDPESLLSVRVADRLRALSAAGTLHGVWTKIANERKCSRILGLILKAMGLLPGVPDFMFIGQWGGGLIELKIEDGRDDEKQLSEFQKYFRFWCYREGVRYAVCRSVEEVEAKLESWGALS